MTNYDTCECPVCTARREKNYRLEQREQMVNYLSEILGREPNRFDLCECPSCTKRRNEKIAKALEKPDTTSWNSF